ncbi:hypothetical protein MTR62_11275 [Novosphingobium sp. 1949]|uniref:DUF3828 domain-containing protein n=1 Tax=Novosphingobium organovorum TaxID=2930092 RepID=A0ABT0BDY2_9SPHN|nr:hypothetical protein [Novosphingobium organovorum]MCJ2183267.1 hypothetical protein [Novosphingobium organovorum]
MERRCPALAGAEALMKILSSLSLAAAVLASIPFSAMAAANPALDFHTFERRFGDSGAIFAGYDQVRQAVPAGSAVEDARALLRRAGAQCDSVDANASQLRCYYRDLLGAEQYSASYATWDVALDLAGGKVSAVRVVRSTEQRS